MRRKVSKELSEYCSVGNLRFLKSIPPIEDDPNRHQSRKRLLDDDSNRYQVGEVLLRSFVRSNIRPSVHASFLSLSHSQSFLKVNPNGRVPALQDGDLTVFESGAILSYLAEKYDSSGTYQGKDVKEKALINSWLFHQVSGLGPVQGQCVYMDRYFEKTYGEAPSDAVKKRFRDECDRLYKVFDGQLERQKAQGSDWVVLDRMTNADISYFGWVCLAGFVGM